MDKKIIKAMFDNICATDIIRPVMNGIHFEEDRCYATDGHVLVIYGESDKRFSGKTILPNGKEIDGIFPNVDKVFPKEWKEEASLKIDTEQLRNACIWHQRTLNATKTDRVVIKDTALSVQTLTRFLNVINLFSKEHTFEFYGRVKPVLANGGKVSGLIMPCEYEEQEVDKEPDYECDSKVYSYEAFINDYIFNSWRKTEEKPTMGWLD